MSFIFFWSFWVISIYNAETLLRNISITLDKHVRICYNIVRLIYRDIAKSVKAQDFDSCISLVRVQLSLPFLTETASAVSVSFNADSY